MQYLINTCGEVAKTETKSYVIEAKNEIEAVAKAKELFADEHNTIRREFVYAKIHDKNRIKKMLLACLFILVSVVISFFKWDVKSFWSFIKPKEISLGPDMISCVVSCFFFSAYVVRFKGIQKTVSSVIDVISSILVILLISSFCQMILTAENLRLFGLIPLNFMKPEVLLIVAVIFSWLGMKFVSVAVLCIISLMAVSNIIQLNDAMGIWGVIYILSAFIGILMWLAVEPSVIEALPKLKKDVLSGYKKVRNEFSEASGEIGKAEQTAKQISQL